MSNVVDDLCRRLSARSAEPELALLGAVLECQTSSHTLADVCLALQRIDDTTKEILHASPLAVVPALVPFVRSTAAVDSDAAHQILALMGDSGNPKECVLVVQEQVERMVRVIEGRDEEEYDDGEAGQEDEDDPAAAADVREFLALVGLSCRSIPRLVRRRLSPLDMLRPLLAALSSLFRLVVSSAPSQDASILLQAVLKVSTASRAWVAELDVPQQLVAECDNALVTFALGSLSYGLDDIETSIAERCFDKLRPRYRIPGRQRVPEGWEEGQRVMEDTLAGLNVGSENLAQTVCSYDPTDETNGDACLGSLALLVHCFQDQLRVLDIRCLFTCSLPVVLLSLSSGHAVDINVAWLWCLTDAALLRGLEFEDDDVISAIQSLVPVAALSPQPTLRFIAFRLLAALLDLCSPPVELLLLRDLMSTCPFPQMQVAAVGLVKEKILSALSKEEPSPFNTPQILQVLGPVILRPQPADLFSGSLLLSDFIESSEPARLTECLGLVYVWKAVDKNNRTAVADAMPELHCRLFTPLALQISKWRLQHDNTEGVIALSSLVIALERLGVTVG